ncbi:hypothetical protein Bca52824_052848 [Brassica carinata]|uniref:Uncharacterized protein n=1 Tax=Brassica carinata TaxID=52824 RepID=A0A8X7R7Z1_BRACI|nr:hypothetical protein Bca52824_052848 [Brassica carinata]
MKLTPFSVVLILGQLFESDSIEPQRRRNCTVGKALLNYIREPCHNLDVKTKEGDTSPQRKFLSPIDIHEINDDMTRETILTCDVEGCYLTDEPIYDVSDAEVFIDSHYYMDPLFNDDDDIQGDNNRCDVHVVVDEGYICGSREHMNHGLGEKDGHRQFHHEPPDRGWHKEHTYCM